MGPFSRFVVSVPQNRQRPGFWLKKGTPGSFWPPPPTLEKGRLFSALVALLALLAVLVCSQCWQCWQCVGGGAGSASSAACANDSVVLEPFLVLLLILAVFLPKDVIC